MTYASEVIADAPVGYWRLGDRGAGTTVADSSGNGSTGNYDAGVTDQPGLLTSSGDRAVDTSSGKVNITATSTPLKTFTGTAFTIEAWVKFTNTAAGTGTATWDYVYEQGINSNTSKVYLWWGRLNSITGWTVGFCYTTGQFRDHQFAWVPTAGQTYHIVATFDGTTVTLYVNGASIGTKTQGAGSVIADGATAKIGGYGIGTGGNFSGVVDEVSVYPTGLTSTRVTAHYSAGTAAPSNAEGVLAFTAPTATITATGNDLSDTAINNAASLRSREGAAAVDIDVPVTAAPAGISFATRVEKGLVYPTPTLVDGRPT